MRKQSNNAEADAEGCATNAGNHQKLVRTLANDDRQPQSSEYGALIGPRRFQRTTNGPWWSEMVKVSCRNLPSKSGTIIKYYWSIKYIKGRDDKMIYHSLPPPNGIIGGLSLFDQWRRLDFEPR